MKYVLILMLSVVGIQFAQANSCSRYFHRNQAGDLADIQNFNTFHEQMNQFKSQLLTPEVQTTNGADLSVRVLDLIRKAEKDSIVFIFTPELAIDGIGSSLLLNMIPRTYMSEGVKFVVRVNGPYSSEGFLKLLAESSQISIQSVIRSNNVDFSPGNNNQSTLIVAQTSKGLEYLQFKGSINNGTLKERDNGTHPIKIPGLTRMVAPFKDTVPFSTGVIESQNSALLQLQAMERLFTRTYSGFEEGMTWSLAETVNNGAYDYMAQIYYYRFKKIPKKPSQSKEEEDAYLSIYTMLEELARRSR